MQKEAAMDVIGRKISMNKTEKVLEHLKKHGSITSLEAIETYGATRLSAIIFNLRKDGHKIITETIPFEDRFGNKSNFAKYILQDEVCE